MELTRDGDLVTASAEAYVWRWDVRTDEVVIMDDHQRLMAKATLQPVVLVADVDGVRTSSAGELSSVRLDGATLGLTWENVNTSATMTMTLEFEPQRFWVTPVGYRDGSERRVVSMHQFAQPGERPRPTLRHTYFVQPGLSMSPAVSPIQQTELGLDLTSWLGRGSMGADSQIYQQWGLPVHYFCGVNRAADSNSRDSLTARLSAAFCCGLASIPTSDLMFDFRGQAISPVFSVRDDLWADSAARQELGARLVFTFGNDYREAIRSYYATVIDVMGLSVPVRSPAKRELLASSQFNTWGAQCAAERVAGRFDEALLDSIYGSLREAGMRSKVFVIDDKWEGAYGVLAHDEERFPRFEHFLDQLRADGFRVGLWAAFLRTNDPTSIGLTTSHLLIDRSGSPIEKNNEFAREPYYLFDISQDEVADAISRQIAEFVRRYDPDLVKFDFGYELPSLALSRPANAEFAGEMLLKRALDVIVGALRAAKPDIAIMYYNLSPLFIDRIDQVGHDDMYLAIDSYDFENNRRTFFSSLLAERGVSMYASGGYSWKNMRDIWFDTAVVGNVGSVNGFDRDENGDLPSPSLLALYNGLSAIARPPGPCRIEPTSPISVGGVAGARSKSWVRYEGDAIVGLAVRAADGARFASDVGITSDADVVLVALDGHSLSASKRVGCVAFGPGSLHFHGRTPSRVTLHMFDQTTAEFSTMLAFDNSASTANPVEWVDLSFD